MQSGLQEVSEYLCAQQGNGDTTKVLSAVKSMGENLKLLSTGSNSIVNLVNRFKDYARKGESEREKHPLVEIIDGALFLLRHRIKQGVAVSKTVDAGLNVLCDHQEMTQVFMNLFNNSIDAMERNTGAIEVEAKPEDGNVLVFVRDTGGGIPEELAGEVFKPFFTTKGKAQGTGLGLFIVKHIIEDHGGSVALETGAEKGAAFKIVLPLG
jgi:two-component system sensor kinase FixL